MKGHPTPLGVIRHHERVMLLSDKNEIFIILTFVDEYRAIPLCDDGIEAFGGCTQSVVDAVFFFPRAA